ncbi:MAG: P-loop NTPase, partial [Pseudonocardiaceae bacterium]
IGQALLKRAARLAVILVVTPAEVAHLDTGRLITVLRQLKVPILGGVENMAHLACPSCDHRIDLHPPTPPQRTIWSRDTPRIATVPYRPGGSPSTEDLTDLAATVRAHLRNGQAR